MGWTNLLAIAIALAMDAFAVAVAAGLILTHLTPRRVFRLSFHFGLFQALMPVLGWAAGALLQRHFSAFDHWVAFCLLGFAGGRMMYEAMRGEETPGSRRDPTTGWDLVLLSFATSIDALAVGVSLAFLGSTIMVPALVIGLVAAAFTIAGMSLGRRIGAAWGRRFEIIGGLILLAIGARIVAGHLTG
jgi:putative Mn2+ efflux pump MntP